MGKTDDDGFGWVMLNQWRAFGERCLEPEYFENGFFKPVVPEFAKSFMEEKAKGNMIFGKLPEVLSGGLLVHARISTNSVSMMNTHPFLNKKWAMIHNGIVYNEGPVYDKKTTNDSEHILHYLTEGGVEAVTKNVSGYYAVGALNRNTGETLVMKDGTANLHACYIPFLDSMAFGTNPEQLKYILKGAGFKFSKVREVIDNKALVFGRDGQLVSETEIIPLEKKWSHDDAYWADYQSSMGYGLDDGYQYGGGTASHRQGLVPDAPGDTREEWNMVNGGWVRTLNPATQNTQSGFHNRMSHEQSTSNSHKAGSILDSYRRYDFTDENGSRIPYYRLDEMFLFQDYRGTPLTAAEFVALSENEQEFCEIMDKSTGNPVGKLAS